MTKNLVRVKKNGHYKHLMSMGRVFPSTATQVKNFIKLNRGLDVLEQADIFDIESFMAAFGYHANFKKTGSGKWLTLTQHLKRVFVLNRRTNE